MIRFLVLALALALSSPSSAQYIGGLGTGGPSQQHPGYITSNWYSMMTPGPVAINAGINPGANVVFCSTAYIPIATTIKTLGVSPRTGGGAGFVGMAIYTNTSARPGTLIDYATAATTGAAGSVAGTVHNTIDTLAPGTYWICYSLDNNTNVLQATDPRTLTGAWAIGSATITNMQSGVTNISGIKCTVSGSTCGGSGTGWGIWSAGVFAWGDATAVTWTDSIANGLIISMRVN